MKRNFKVYLVVAKNKLSIIVPVFNEIANVEKVVKGLQEINLDWVKEIIIIDDGSTDGSGEYLKKLSNKSLRNKSLSFVFHKVNKGKGAAVKSGLSRSTGDYIVIFDSDGECDPQDLKTLLKQVDKGGHDAVFGNRYSTTRKNTIRYNHFYWGVKFLAVLINILYAQNISDPEMGMKLIRRDRINFDLTEKGFGQEIEWTTKLAKQGIKIQEVPVRYYPRTFEEGKKITYKDGIKAIYLIFKYRFF